MIYTIWYIALDRKGGALERVPFFIRPPCPAAGSAPPARTGSLRELAPSTRSSPRPSAAARGVVVSSGAPTVGPSPPPTPGPRTATRARHSAATLPAPPPAPAGS